MKLKNNYTLTGLAGEYVAVPLDQTDSFHGIIKLNESGAEVFRLLNEGKQPKEIERKLMEKYQGLDGETAAKAVAVVLDSLRKSGLLED